MPRTHSLSEVRARWAVRKDDGEAEATSAENEGITYLATGEETQDVVSVTGRLIFMRNTGKLCFATLQDGDGTQLQAMLSLAEIGEDVLTEWKADVDLGDLIGVTGRVIASLRGELSVMASEWLIAAKSLRPLPVAFAEMNEETRAIALQRSGYRPVPAHYSRAIPQARCGRRHRSRLRDQPQLPQRGRR